MRRSERSANTMSSTRRTSAMAADRGRRARHMTPHSLRPSRKHLDDAQHLHARRRCVAPQSVEALVQQGWNWRRRPDLNWGGGLQTEWAITKLLSRLAFWSALIFVLPRFRRVLFPSCSQVLGENQKVDCTELSRDLQHHRPSHRRSRGRTYTQTGIRSLWRIAV